MLFPLFMLVSIQTATGQGGVCNKACCPCFCCGTATNGECDLLVAKPQCLNVSDTKRCAEVCFRMRGVTDEPCDLPWGAYPTQDCASCMRSQPNSTRLPLAAKVPPAAPPKRVRDVHHRVKSVRQRVVAGRVAVRGVESAGLRAERLDRVHNQLQNNVEATLNASSPEDCVRTCCTCWCCTKAVCVGGSCSCRESQTQNVCVTGGRREDCTKPCADWYGADAQACGQGWPPISYVVGDCSDCLS
jgi:hypothetical protein